MTTEYRLDPVPHRVFLVEDDALIREAYVTLIGEARDLEITGEASTATEAVEKLSEQGADLIVVDISLPDVSGLALISHLRQHFPSLPSLVISGHDPAVYASRAFDAGARGYLDKKEAASQLVDAIRMVLNGRTYLASSVMI